MASTLLAVDDSVTMRKVLEITFAGQDYGVVTANSSDSALQKLKSDKPALVIADGTLEPKNGYDLCKEIKKISPTTPVLFLSSKQNPFDPAKGASAQVDDHMDKPFDTQQMIDKVKKLLAGGVAKPAAAPTVASTAPTAPAAAAPVAAPPLAQTRNAGVATTPGVAGPAPTAQTPMQRAKTLIYNPPNVAATPAPAAPPAAPAKAPPIAPTPAAGMPQQGRSATIESPALALPPTVAQTVQTPLPRELTTAAAAVGSANGQMSGKLEQLGLTPQQIEAVLALSREVVEKVVWEVVPVLAESIIKEEIARLTK